MTISISSSNSKQCEDLNANPEASGAKVFRKERQEKSKTSRCISNQRNQNQKNSVNLCVKEYKERQVFSQTTTKELCETLCKTSRDFVLQKIRHHSRFVESVSSACQYQVQFKIRKSKFKIVSLDLKIYPICFS